MSVLLSSGRTSKLFQVPRNGVANSYAGDVASLRAVKLYELEAGSLSHTARREIRPPKMPWNRRVEFHLDREGNGKNIFGVLLVGI